MSVRFVLDTEGPKEAECLW